MYRLQEDSITEMEIKKSRFITYLHKCFEEQDAKDFIQSIRKMHPNANHHCYAMILGEHNDIQRSNDDGEPKGTAGVPMLECLMHRNMQDIVAVCVRYFGGIKLGAGGLIRAYSHCVSNALSHSTITKKECRIKCHVAFSYDFIGKVDHFFRTENIEVLEKDYQELVHYTFLCKDIPTAEFLEFTSGMYQPEQIEECIIDVPVHLETDALGELE